MANEEFAQARYQADVWKARAEELEARYETSKEIIRSYSKLTRPLIGALEQITEVAPVKLRDGSPNPVYEIARDALLQLRGGWRG